MKRAMNTISVVGALVLVIALIGIVLAIYWQWGGSAKKSIESLTSCSEGVYLTPLKELYPGAKFYCHSSVDTAPTKNDLKEGKYLDNWQYVIKSGCTDDKPYCWANYGNGQGIIVEAKSE